MILNGVAVAGIVVMGVLGIVERTAPGPRPVPWLHVGAIVSGLLVLAFNARRLYTVARSVAVVAYTGLPALAVLLSDTPLRGRYILVGLSLATAYVFERRASIAAVFTLQVLVFMALEDGGDLTLVNVFRYAFFFGLIYGVVDLFRREGERRQQRIEAQRQDLARAHAALQASTARLEAVSALKDRVLSVLAHDLRSPLFSLSALLQLSAEGVVDERERPALDAELRDRLRLVQGVLDDVLDWATPLVRRSTGGADAEVGRADLDALIARALAQAAPTARDKGIALVAPSPSGLRSPVDDGRVLLVLRNLLSNALKFTSEGGSVSVEVETSEGRPCVRVRDTGRGMTPEQLTALFDGTSLRTTRGTAGEAGSGLGLLLCHEFATHIGGRLDLASEPGVGTTVTVTLPSAQTETLVEDEP